MKMIVLRKVVITFIICFSLMPAQLEKVEFKPEPTKMVEFGDLGAGPYKRLVIRNVMVLPGHGGPATGPYDILVTGNVIAKLQRHDSNNPDRMEGDRVMAPCDLESQ